MTFQSGEINGKRWVCGDVPIGKEKTIYLDTRTGEGVAQICELLSKFIFFQSNKVKLPFSSREDISQELYVLALEAIPNYNINKNANILTFLQGHVQRRLINKYKFFSEKKRRATYYNISTYKIRCPACKKFSITADKDTVSCSHCGNEGKVKKWKKYNLPILSLPFTCVEDRIAEMLGSSDAGSLQEVLGSEYQLSYFLGETHHGLECESQKRIDFLRIFNRLDKTNQEIISMLLEGYAYKEIASQIGISEKATYARVAKIIDSQKIE